MIQVKEIHQHSDYKSTNFDYDYSLLRLKEKIIFDNTRRSVPLPEKNEVIEDETFCSASGWGDTYNSSESMYELRQVLVPTWNCAKCVDAYRNHPVQVTPRMICAGYEKGGKDSETHEHLQNKIVRLTY